MTTNPRSILHSSDMKYTNKENWHEIERQYVFEAMMPFVPNRPLDFFVPESEGSINGQITNSFGNFNANAEHKVVLTLKRRKVVILTTDEHCHDTSLQDVTVAKIISIRKEQRTQEWYNLLVNDKHPLFVYIPESVTGQECFVNLSSVTTIGKKMLLSKKSFIPSERMTVINERIKECIDLGVVKTENDEVEEASNE